MSHERHPVPMAFFNTAKFLSDGGRIRLRIKDSLVIREPFSKDNKPYPPASMDIKDIGEFVDIDKLQGGCHYLFLPNPVNSKTFILLCKKGDAVLNKEVVPYLSLKATEDKYKKQLEQKKDGQ